MQHHPIQNAVTAINGLAEVKNVKWNIPAGDGVAYVEVYFRSAVVSYEAISAVLVLIRKACGTQSVSRFYQFRDGCLRLAVTPCSN